MTDFLLLGGGSLFVLVPLAFFWSPEWTGGLAGLMLFLANLVNHPHFAHSYQLFYRNFGARAFGDAFPPALRLRYVFAGIVAPVAIMVLFAVCLMRKDVLALGYIANLMAFLVGWHYVKQGYGMLMLAAALKRSYFNEHEKLLLRWNGYVVWLASWVWINQMLASRTMWGVRYGAITFPGYVLTALLGLVVLALGVVVVALVRKRIRQREWDVPVNGLVAYAVSLYPWLLLRHPAFLLVVPAFHSLQYLAVVWRYQQVFESSAHQAGARRAFNARGVAFHLALFGLYGFILGYLGFWFVPEMLQNVFPQFSRLFGGALFLFLFWVFINIHHYFLDNVMWRKDNPDTRRYLFGAS